MVRYLCEKSHETDFIVFTFFSPTTTEIRIKFEGQYSQKMF